MGSAGRRGWTHACMIVCMCVYIGERGLYDFGAKESSGNGVSTYVGM